MVRGREGVDPSVWFCMGGREGQMLVRMLFRTHIVIQKTRRISTFLFDKQLQFRVEFQFAEDPLRF